MANLLILAGLAWAAVACWRLLSNTSRRRTRRAFLTSWPFVVPQSLVALGFALSGATDTIWLIVAAGAVALLSACAVQVLRRLALRTGVESSGPALAVVLVTSSLLQLGVLLLVRLVIVADPAEGFGGGLTGRAWQEAWGSMLVPMLVVAGLLVVAWLVLIGRLPRLGWFLARVAATGRGFHRLAYHQQVQSAPPFARSTVTWAIVGGIVASLGLFLLPLLDGVNARANLTFLGIATPEYGKVVFLLPLALLVARHGHRFDAGRGIGPRVGVARMLTLRPGLGEFSGLWLRYRYALFPIGLFVVVAASSAIRKDFGTIVPALAGTIGVTWSASWHAARGAGHAPDGPSLGVVRRLLRTLRAYRVFVIVGIAIVAIAGTVAVRYTDYVDERARVWSDPWAFRWEGGCVDPASYPPGLAPVPGRPALCLEALVANVESARSQVAQALAATADGGAWGRGLQDTASGRVPAGNTDFILAVVWNKLGGLTVLVAALLIVLLAAALRQVTAPANAPRAMLPSPVALFAAGLAAMIVGQYLFVLAATLNVVPHSGIPAPFLSRGGHATLALLLGIAAVLVLAAGLTSTAPPSAVEPAGAPSSAVGGPAVAPSAVVGPADGRSSNRWLPGPHYPGLPWRGVLLAFAVCVALAANVTVAPYQKPGFPLPTVYDSARPLCPSRASSGTVTPESLLSVATVDAATCSTDVLAFDRTRIEIRLPGGSMLLQKRPGMTWALTGGDLLHGLGPEDLTGLVKVGGNDIGLLERSFPQIISGTIGTTLARRLSPHTAGLGAGLGNGDRGADGALEITIDPRLQHAAAVALRSNGPAGAGPLAGGIVAIDAKTGEVLVSASAPGHLPPQVPVPASEPTAEVQRFLDQHNSYVEWTDGQLDGAVPDEVCSRDQLNMGEQRSRNCWKWSTRDAPPDTSQADKAERRRYIADMPGMKLPSPDVNRALGQRYGLGSTFKVVIAAAYLDRGGHADDLIEAPEILRLAPNVEIKNAGGSCAGPTGLGTDRITLRQALSGSCNTAFVRLAQEMGWPAVAEQARLFGLVVGRCPKDAAPWLAVPLTGATASCVPADVDAVAIGNSALGGQDVQGTPLAMATVMAAVANHGQARQPTLVRSMTYPVSGRTTQAVPDQVTALAPSVADELVQALSDTAVNGTASGLQRSVGRTLWVKTGTHELTGPLDPEEFVRVNSWMVGFTATPQGRPVSFAVVVEAGDDKTGSERVRHLAQQLCIAIGGAT